MRLAVAEEMSPAAESGLGLGRIEGTQEGLSRPSPMTKSMEDIEYSDSKGNTGAVDPPKASPTVAKPDNGAV